MGKVIPFTGITCLDMPPEHILDAAKAQDLEGVIVMGFRKDGKPYFASSYADGGTVNWLADTLKYKLQGIME